MNHLNKQQRLQNEKRKLDAMEQSDIFKGFTREEIREMTIEMPQLWKEEK
jgi:hypothetical protein